MITYRPYGRSGVSELDLVDLECDRRHIFRSADLQLLAQGTLDAVARGADRLDRVRGVGLDELRWNEGRLRDLQRDGGGSAELYSGRSAGNAVREVEAELRTLRGGGGKSGHRSFGGVGELSRCPSCGKAVLASLRVEHESSCRGKSSTQVRENAPVTVPQPPRNIHIESVGYDSIALRWEPPILDGGATIYDHEIFYSRFRITHVGKRVLRDAVTMPPVRTSQWCLRRPIIQGRFILRGLEASTEYVDIRMRCRNNVGWSAWSDPVLTNTAQKKDRVCCNPLVVKTDKPIAPSVPLFFSSDKVTSSSIEFQWRHPFDFGGVPIERYELECTVVVPRNNQTLGTGRPSERTTEVRRILTVDGNETCCSLSGLRGGTRVKDIKFRAVNSSGLESETVSCSDLRTLDASFVQLLLKEIERVKESVDDFIDSDLLTGVVQREERWQYQRRLEDELKKLGPGADWRRAGESDPSLDSSAKDELSTSSVSKNVTLGDIVPDYERRKLQYLYRMRRIKEDISECHNHRRQLAEQRNHVASLLARAQERIHSLNAEVDRVATYDGGRSITSSVLHEYAEQRFDVRQLQKELQAELKKVRGDIATWKAQIIESDEKSHGLLDVLERKEDRLKERRAAYKKFEQQAESVANARQMVSRTPQDVLRHYFRMWAKSCQNRKKMRHALVIMESSSIRCAYLYTIQTWRDALRGWAERSLGERASEVDGIIGRGGVLLQQAGHEQQKNVAFSSSLVQLLATAKETNRMATEKAELVEKHSFDESASGYFLRSADQTLLLKGDFYFDADRYEDALRCYDDLLHSISNDEYSRVARAEIAGLYYYLYAKKGTSLFCLGQLNNAVVSLDRSLSIAEELGSDSAIGNALLALAKCHAARNEIVESISRFKASIPVLARVGDEKGEAEAHKGLQSCYEKRGMLPHAKESEDNANAIAFRSERKISSALEALDRWRGKLINVTAKESKVTTLERATPHFIELKKDYARVLREIEDAKLDVAGKISNISRLEELMYKIKQQLSEAQTTNKRKLVSSLVHDNTQEFDVDELVRRLGIKLEEVEEELSEASMTRDRLETDIINMNDDVKCIEEDMQVERGPLMQRVLQNNMNVRCIGLSASNTAGNDLTGGATNGTSRCVVTAEKDIYIYNIHTGTLDAVFAGDGEGRHVGDIRGHASFVTCVFFLGSHLYTGSKDMTVMCWDVGREELLYICRGHEATVTCVHADGSRLISGSADTTIRVWDGKTGEAIRTVRGHCRGVLCLECGPSWCVSGDSDGLIFIWDENFRCLQRLSSRLCRITAIQFGQLEIISGDSKGFLTIWWIKSGKALRRCKGHEGAVLDLQFDATKVVSCGLDKNVNVIDILTGDILQTLRGHTDSVLSVAFDGKNVLSASRDGTLRWWEWGDQRSQRSNKVHTYSAGENLSQIAKVHNVAVSSIIQWNNIKDIKKVYPGQKLIVCKADPNKPTDAELKALKQKSARMMAATSRAGKFGGTVPSAADTNSPKKKANINLHTGRTPGSLASRVVHVGGDTEPSTSGTDKKPQISLDMGLVKEDSSLATGMSLASRIQASKERI